MSDADIVPFHLIEALLDTRDKMHAAQLGEIRSSVDRVGADVTMMVALQREANGRIGKVEAVVPRVESAEATIADVRQNGCARFDAHRVALETLEGVPIAVADQAPRIRGLRGLRLSSPAGIAVVGGGGLLGGAGLVTCVEKLVAAATWIVHHVKL